MTTINAYSLEASIKYSHYVRIRNNKFFVCEHGKSFNSDSIEIGEIDDNDMVSIYPEKVKFIDKLKIKSILVMHILNDTVPF